MPPPTMVTSVSSTSSGLALHTTVTLALAMAGGGRGGREGSGQSRSWGGGPSRPAGAILPGLRRPGGYQSPMARSRAAVRAAQLVTTGVPTWQWRALGLTLVHLRWPERFALLFRVCYARPWQVHSSPKWLHYPPFATICHSASHPSTASCRLLPDTLEPQESAIKAAESLADASLPCRAPLGCSRQGVMPGAAAGGCGCCCRAARFGHHLCKQKGFRRRRDGAAGRLLALCCAGRG